MVKADKIEHEVKMIEANLRKVRSLSKQETRQVKKMKLQQATKR